MGGSDRKYMSLLKPFLGATHRVLINQGNIHEYLTLTNWGLTKLGVNIRMYTTETNFSSTCQLYNAINYLNRNEWIDKAPVVINSKRPKF